MEIEGKRMGFGTNHYFNNFYYVGNLVIKEHTINQRFWALFFTIYYRADVSA